MIKILCDLRTSQATHASGIARLFCSLIERLAQKDDVDISVISYKSGFRLTFSDYFSRKARQYYFEELETYYLEKFDFFLIDDLLFTKDYDINQFFDQLFPQKLLASTDQIVAVVHDLILLIFADEYLPTEGERMKKYLIQLESVKLADHLFANSENTRRDFVKYLGVDPNKITAIYGGVGAGEFNSGAIYSASDRTNDIAATLGFDKRKNILGLIKAFGMAYNSGNIPKDALLVLCTNPDEYHKKLIQDFISGINLPKGQVVITGYLSDSKLAELTGNSRATVFPSLYEGLGMPVLESYACATPCFASNNSSMKELVLPECSFDPYNIYDISQSMIKIYQDPALCVKSVEFGKQLLAEKFNWVAAANKVYNKLLELKENFHRPLRTAVFGVLPPENTGIAEYNVKVFGINSKFDVFSKFQSVSHWNDAKISAGRNYQNNFFPLEMYNAAKQQIFYPTKIFIIGNSPHNFPYIKMAVLETDKKKSWLYLHEALIIGTLIIFLNKNSLYIKKLINLTYPELSEQLDKISDSDGIIGCLLAHRFYGIRLLINITGVTNIIVNNGRAKKLITNELRNTVFEDQTTILDVFHPIYGMPELKKLIFVGAYGHMVSLSKGFLTIAEAIFMLRQNNNLMIRGLVVGYEAKLCCNSLPVHLKDSFIYVDGVSDDEFDALLAFPDIFVQLRNSPHGESSGVIRKALSLGKIVIATEGSEHDKIAENCYLVQPYVSPEKLAETIIYALQDKRDVDTEGLMREFSCMKLSNILGGL